MSPLLNMYLAINKFKTALILLNFSCHYFRKRLTLDIGIFPYIDVI
jgi:hypothetical protein